MLSIRGIVLGQDTKDEGVYLTSVGLNTLISYALTQYDMDDILYADGRRHIGSEISKVYKALYGTGNITHTSMMYLQATPTIIKSFTRDDIPYYAKALNRDSKVRYIQMADLTLVSIILGKFMFSDKQIRQLLDLIEPIPYNVSKRYIVAGNKPEQLSSKPLLKIVNERETNKFIEDCRVIRETPNGIQILLPSSAKKEYVKTSTLLRKDIYITIKALSASQKRNMYEVIEEILAPTIEQYR